MNKVSVTDVTEGVPDPVYKEAEPVECTTIYVYIASESYKDAASRYGFTEEQNEMLEELIQPLSIHFTMSSCYQQLN